MLSQCRTWLYSPLRDNVKACLLFHKCPARSHRGWLHILPHLVQFPLTHCTWPPLLEKAIGSSIQFMGIVSVCWCAVSYIFGPNVTPLTVRRISSLHVMNSRSISCFVAWMWEAVWLLLPEQFSSPREDQRHEEDGHVDFPAISLWMEDSMCRTCNLSK